MAKIAQTPEIFPTAGAFSKEQLLQSRRYQQRRDLLSALLEEGKFYSHKDVETLTNEFMKGKVK